MRQKLGILGAMLVVTVAVAAATPARAQCIPTITCPQSAPECSGNGPPCINRRTDPGTCSAAVVNFCGPAVYLCPGQDAVAPPGPNCLTAVDCHGNPLPVTCNPPDHSSFPLGT